MSSAGLCSMLSDVTIACMSSAGLCSMLSDVTIACMSSAKQSVHLTLAQFIKTTKDINIINNDLSLNIEIYYHISYVDAFIFRHNIYFII
jgi:hypothetical protein